ncbi:hypothetical protein RFI_23167 [Reticulomyxa filosa]|uniref:Dilute domain-containing protein n=1 Tax=Reticulomyxa filosa TaxID=46433 RepID=X6MJK6_RETFI|nr:hypothetical protein RFI_23167 [Reticulomyxa filosa]|eukprot:ETO14198.1 hypothetical protein RFI_23167 [Reticulomyxa filosa]
MILLDSKERLQHLVKEKCENALSGNDLKVVLEFARLYPYLDLSKEGLSLYCEALKRETMMELENRSLLFDCKEFVDIKNSKEEHIPYVSVLEGLVDALFTVINDNVNNLKQMFGEGSELLLAQKLYGEADREIHKLLAHYIQHFDLPKLAKFVKLIFILSLFFSECSYLNFFACFQENNREYFEKLLQQLGFPLDKLDELLQEIAHVCSELESFDATMRSYMSDAKQMIEQSNNSLLEQEVPKNFPAETKINTIRHQYISYYIILEQFNMQYKLYRVLTTKFFFLSLIMNEDNIHNEEQLISSSSELSFFVLKKIAIRAFNTYDVNAACAVINHISNTLDGFYKEWLDMNLRQQKGQEDKSFAEHLWQQSKKTLYSSTAIKSPEESKTTIIILNNLDQSMSNTYTLKGNGNNFSDISEKEKFKVRHCLDMLFEISKAFERIVERGISRYAQSYHGYLEASLDRFRNFSYLITEKQFLTGTFELNRSAPSNLVVSAASDVVGVSGASGGLTGTNLIPFVDHLEQSFRPHLFALSRQLTSANFDRMLTHLLQFFNDRLEQIILQQRFTFWGGMQLDKDRQRLETFFSELSKTRSIRDHFSRTRQIVSLLQLTKVEEVKNYLSGHNATSSGDLTSATSANTLSTDEILKFLRLRIEFTPAQIQKIKEQYSY